jgi:hypothetical protein
MRRLHRIHLIEFMQNLMLNVLVPVKLRHRMIHSIWTNSGLDHVSLADPLSQNRRT